MTRLQALAPVAVLLFALAGCGGGGGDRDAFVEALTEDGQLTADQAGCVFDELSETLDADQVQALTDITVEPDDPEVAQAAITAFETCLDF